MMSARAEAICSGINLIQTGQAEIVVAGGVETMSDVPIKFSKPLRERMLASRKVKGLSKQLGLLKGLKLKDLAPEAPSISNFITGEVMGHSSDRLADAFGVSRQDSDEFALRSHHAAAKAHADGIYDDEVLEYKGSRVETGVRGESTIEKLSSLKAAFVKPHGTVTAANASYLTDGASATLIMSEEKALELGYKPKVRTAARAARDSPPSPSIVRTDGGMARQAALGTARWPPPPPSRSVAAPMSRRSPPAVTPGGRPTCASGRL